ncbi:MAG: hypothetical protein IJY97_08705 [Clostridia bacterium]|nr:hypothetical protein [Clostridia bacterium]
MFKNLTKKRLTILLVSLSLILVVGVGVTLAYVFASTGDVVNTFTPSKVACAVVEMNNNSQETTQVSAGKVEKLTSKQAVHIKNTGNTTAYIRAAIIVTWKKADETGTGTGTVYAKSPVENVDYIMQLNLSADGWVLGADGYYYYTQPVAAGDMTGMLISSATAGAGLDGYSISIEIVASAIQSTPTDVVTTQWKSGVSGVNGTTLTIIESN